MKPLYITLLAPHIDDAVIGAGGSIAKHISLGNKVNVIYFSSGRTEEEIEIREAEASKVASFLGIDSYDFLKQTFPFTRPEVVHEVVALLRRHGTNILYAPHLNDADIEHVHVAQVAARCQWMANNNDHLSHLEGNCDIKGVFFYEVHRPIQNVHYLEDITKFMEVKYQALQLFPSQLAVASFDQGILGLNTYRGTMTETSRCAEAFQVSGLRGFFGSDE